MSLTTTNEKGLAATNDQAPENTTNTAIVGQAGAERKELATLATLAARLALQNYSLHELAGGGFLIARWDRTAHCPDLRAVAGFLRRIEGGQE